MLNLLPLVGSHLLPDALAFPECLLLRRSQLIPGLKALADSRLLIRRQIPEALVVLEEFLLPVRRHIFEALEDLRGQAVRLPWVAPRPHGVRAVGPRELRAARWRLRLANLAELLPEGRRTEQSRRQESGQKSPELGT